MDTFFQKLRDIQKKERTTGSLSKIEDTFYDDASEYLQELLKQVDKSPLSLEAYQLRDAQRITIEIRERREFKIITTATTNVQKSHNLFRNNETDKSLLEEVPLNATPEEAKLYRELIDVMIENREGLLSEIKSKRTNENKIGFKPEEKEDKEESTEKSVDDEINSLDDKIAEQELYNIIQEDNKKDSDNKNETGTKKESDSDQSDIEKVSDNKNMDNTTDSSVTSIEDNKEASANSPIDEQQIALMYGEAPDDTILDEDNNPVNLKKTDIKTPFKKPEVPKEDTITLQNNGKEESQRVNSTDVEENNNNSRNLKEDSSVNKETKNESSATTSIDTQDTQYQSDNQEVNKDNLGSDIENQKLKSQSEKIENNSSKEVGSEDTTDATTSESVIEDTSESNDSSIDENIQEDTLVEFKKKVSTDILDENLRSYGPFEKHDMVLLPKSLIRILLNRKVIDLL